MLSKQTIGLRRVVVTGMGIVSCLGNSPAQVLQALRQGRSGIAFNLAYAQAGLRSHVSGRLEVDFQRIDRRHRRFMGDAAAYGYLAMADAIADARLTPEQVADTRTGCVMGSGGGSSEDIVEANQLLHSQGVRKVGPYRVPRTMTSTVSACLASFFGIKGLNYSIASACATSAHCIGHAFEQIQFGKQDVVFAGGAEAEHFSQSCMFDAMGAFSTGYNDRPATASRPYDVARDGFVISGGAGVLVLEALEHAQARGATILAEVIGYGTASDGQDMVSPSGDGALRAMQMALASCAEPVDYLNTHGTSTQAGDLVELQAALAAFDGELPPFSSTKSLSGHALGAAGVHEAIYALLMMRHGFMAASHNIEQLDPQVEGLPLVRSVREGQQVNCVMSNSFGFGGANASLVFSRRGLEAQGAH
ncbi:beta-ketoacyl-ACP synthase I [Pseudomonas aeruginosa]|jgi:3-oxoacyl-[acyl-carrier-protein] synthase-1|uniref:3-oxoacyl-[acyl-carrier-protein] synthase 1 n=2 Tax=Pseudomonas TaxID=286 RepID=A0A7X3F414_9PSED|nr:MULTISPECIES: beta-ketoacyl synthase N-terminal-like domain-containing protein [Pseudomonas]ASD11965.1 beta-ketoacyl-[acyl-carrier-protein] synthase I [Pseudomonas aeruginosa]AVZ34110.1 beta-ketoacyl-[acyl-carrier-protein] synthase I [Pseudomonas aeruginosa]EGB98629.1 3-oxoacyl-ACP synthase [Pseudomonas sp. TJI-51]EKT9079560.1 beta-ketoacyl-ACP synthase I [Pseudomonas aeruginosa]EKY4192112.1 beta-ketoacyl-ACP synthase I [Pseudomonas aeruginosa]